MNNDRCLKLYFANMLVMIHALLLHSIGMVLQNISKADSMELEPPFL